MVEVSTVMVVMEVFVKDLYFSGLVIVDSDYDDDI